MAAGAPARPSRALLYGFSRYLGFFVPRHFHAVRLAGAHNWPASQRPLLVCLNHASWWDPLTSILLSRALNRRSNHYAPMDAVAFRRYNVLGRMGLFPVEQGTPRGGAQFLRGAEHILREPGSVLWLTPQGGFTDVRERPLRFQAGLDLLLRRMPEVTVLPLALEYTFWDERLPEALALLGEPLHFRAGQLANGSRGGEAVAQALTHTQDALAALAVRRDPRLFPDTVLAGGAGTSGIYGGWQRLRALLTGQAYRPEHTAAPPGDPALGSAHTSLRRG